MNAEVHGLPEFYASAPGQVAARLISARIGALWPDCTGRDVLGLGWAPPYMRLWAGQHGRRIMLVPASYGPARGCALTDDGDLPLPDRSLDRILLVHGLEASERARPLLRECWRVLRDDGRLLVVVPNRLGFWARFDHTPFGQGHPYSRGQLSRLLQSRMFHVLRHEEALFIPPFPWRFALRGARLWEGAGRALLRRLAGVALVEAEKDLFAALPAGAAAVGRRVVQPMPARYATEADPRGPYPPGSSARDEDDSSSARA